MPYVMACYYLQIDISKMMFPQFQAEHISMFVLQTKKPKIRSAVNTVEELSSDASRE